MDASESLLIEAEWWIDETGMVEFPTFKLSRDIELSFGLGSDSEGKNMHKWENFEARSYFCLLIREAIK